MCPPQIAFECWEVRAAEAPVPPRLSQSGNFQVSNADAIAFQEAAELERDVVSHLRSYLYWPKRS